MKNRELGLSDWALAEEIEKEYSNFFVGRFDWKQWRRAKRKITLENIKKLIETLSPFIPKSDK